MVRLNEIRRGEVTASAPIPHDAALAFIGRIETPWRDRLKCPRLGRDDGPLCRVTLFEPWRAALSGVEAYERLELLYWLHESRRDVLLQSPRDDGQTRGCFSLRTPVRPNPIGTAIVVLCDVDEAGFTVRGLDCLNGTPLLDVKPHRSLFEPVAPPQPGDFEIGA